MKRPRLAHIVAIAAVVTSCAFVTQNAWAKEAPTKAAPTRSCVVHAGDGWSQLAKAHGTTMQHLLAANHATTTPVKAGQRIHLPADARDDHAHPATTHATPTKHAATH